MPIINLKYYIKIKFPSIYGFINEIIPISLRAAISYENCNGIPLFAFYEQ